MVDAPGRSDIASRCFTIQDMPNIAAILKSEISRVARREARSETLTLKKAVGLYRTEIAGLKRRAETLEQHLRRLSKDRDRHSSPQAIEASPTLQRFSAKGLASQRRRLGLSARDCGLLLGTSAQSIYNWEAGKTRPLARHLTAIAALKTLGKREATSILETRRAAG